MRMHLRTLSPAVIGLIHEHKAEHNHPNLEETVECLVKKAMKKRKTKTMR